MQNSLIRIFAWGLPLVIFSEDTCAWGLFTHVYFAQYIAFSSPFLDSKFRRAVSKFPFYIMAGACLPDLALFSKKFSSTHQWEQSHHLLQSAKTDAEVAIAIGFHSHLFIDVIAHNHFVPTFEAKWKHSSIATHIFSEWAMDAYIASHLLQRPFQLLRDQSFVSHAQGFLSNAFNTTDLQLIKGLNTLAWADRTLRFSQISKGIFAQIKQKDDEFICKLNYYLHQTHDTLTQFEASLNGLIPSIRPELAPLSMSEMMAWRNKCLQDVRLRMTTPLHIFHDHEEHGTITSKQLA